jgi:hypothetical protein
MLRRSFALVGLVAAVLAVACSHQGALRTRAAFDFHCSDGELTMTDLGSGTMGVSGCGHRATYVWIAQNQQWVMNHADEHHEE